MQKIDDYLLGHPAIENNTMIKSDIKRAQSFLYDAEKILFGILAKEEGK